MDVADQVAATVNAIDQQLSEAGRVVKLLWRDDDFSIESKNSALLVSMARRYEIRPLLSAIPGKMSEDRTLSSEFLDSVDLAQHGHLHDSHAADPTMKSEYPSTRDVDEVTRELADDFEKLQRIAGAAFLPMFVPPWSRMDAKFLPCLKRVGFRAFSSYDTHFCECADATFRVTNAALDIANYAPDRQTSIKSVPLLLSVVQNLILKSHRLTNQPDTFVLLTHHKSLRDDGWEFLDAFLRCTTGRGTMRWITFRDLIPRHEFQGRIPPTP